MDLKELVGNRLLIKDEKHTSGVIEVSVMEVSPSGDFVKFSGNSIGNGWRKSAEVSVVEVLNNKTK